MADLGQEDLQGRVVEASAQAEGEVTREGTHPPETHRVENAVSPSPGGRPSPDLTPEQERYWARVLEAESAAITARTNFTPEDYVAVLREALLDDADRDAALGFAQHLPDEQLKALLPQLYETATLTHRSILLTRQLIARLDRQWLTSALGPLVERTLAEGDEEAYRRLAELLDHLEQYGLLARLVEAAAGSEDEEIREVAEDFSRGIPSRN